MEWRRFFRQHILERGEAYYYDGYVKKFKMTDSKIEAEVDGTRNYNVSIDFDDEQVRYMSCSCPYAYDGNFCKHMAAVMFQFEEETGYNEENTDSVFEERISSYINSYKESENDVVNLVNMIPEEDIRAMLTKYVMNDASLKTQLQIKYLKQFDAKQMLELKEEIQNIVRTHSLGGFVDWYHASDFTSELVSFLHTKVSMLIEHDYLEQAFELTNIVFTCIGTIDMDDSDGGTGYVAEACYECWRQILQKSNNKQKNDMQHWFESHRDGYVIDFMEEYVENFLLYEIAPKELLYEKIRELDKILEQSDDEEDWLKNIHYRIPNAVGKKIEYMKLLSCSEDEIRKFRKGYRQFYIVRHMEIEEYLTASDYKNAEKVLIESRKLDEKYHGMVEDYTKQLIDLYDKTGEKDKLISELSYHLINHDNRDLTYFKKLKKEVADLNYLNNLIGQILSKNRNLHFICKILNEEKRYDELIVRIIESGNVYLMDEYYRILKKTNPEQVVNFYSEYVLKAAKRVSQRSAYHTLMGYLRKIKICPGGMDVATNIANKWRTEYKRRTAMMDELNKIM